MLSTVLFVILLVLCVLLKDKSAVSMMLFFAIVAGSLFEHIVRSKCDIFFFSTTYDEFLIGCFIGNYLGKIIKR